MDYTNKLLFSIFLKAVQRNEVKIVYIGVNDSHSFRTPADSFIEFYLVSEGHLQFSCRKTSISLNPGMLLITDAYKGNKGQLEANTRLQIISFQVEKSKTLLKKAIAGVSQTTLLPDRIKNEIELLIFDAFHCFLAPDYPLKTIELSLYAERILVEFLRALPNMDSECHPLGSKARRNLDRNIDNSDFCLEQLAKHCRCSSTHVGRVFKTDYGMTPWQYLMRQRIRKSMHLLRTTNLSVKEIAFASGFKDQLYFSRILRKMIGKSPTMLRDE
jgi:AraC-like DNA-binding protein